MLSGLPEINIEDWRRYTEYSGYDDACPQIQVPVQLGQCYYPPVPKLINGKSGCFTNILCNIFMCDVINVM